MFTRAEYRELFEHVRAELIDTVFEVTKLVAEILSEAAALRKAIKKATSLSTMHAVSDVKGSSIIWCTPDSWRTPGTISWFTCRAI